jgi:hypothetical protein
MTPGSAETPNRNRWMRAYGQGQPSWCDSRIFRASLGVLLKHAALPSRRWQMINFCAL